MDKLQELLERVGPNVYLQAAIIVAAAIVAGKIVDWLITGLVGRWARHTKTDLDDQFVAIMHRPLFVSVILVGLALATRRMQLPDYPTWITLAILKTIAIVIWLGFGLKFFRLLLAFLSRIEDRGALVQSRTVPLFENIAMVALVAAAVYFFFLSWSINVTAWLASAGIVGIAVGFAAKDTLANLFAGVFILVDAPYKVGDFINLDAGERGRVTQIGLRSTRLLTRDDIEVTIPNSVMGATKIINESGGPDEKERLRVAVGVAYGSDIDLVREILTEIAIAHEKVCEDPAPRVRFRGFGNSSLDFELLVWIQEPVLRGLVQDALNCEIYKAFARRGVEIPYPKRDVYIREMPRQG